MGWQGGPPIHMKNFLSTVQLHSKMATQLFYSWQLWTNVPVTLQQWHPTLPDCSRLAQVDGWTPEATPEKNFDSRHRARPLHPPPLNCTVFLPDRQEIGQVISQPVHRSYVVSTPTSNFRRNRRHLNPLPTTQPIASLEHSAQVSTSQNPQLPHPDTPQPVPQPPDKPQQPSIRNPPNQIIIRSGRISLPPQRLSYGKEQWCGVSKEQNLSLLCHYVKESFVLSFLLLFTCFSMVAVRYSPKGDVVLMHYLHSLSLPTCFSCTHTMSVPLHPLHCSWRSWTLTCMPVHTYTVYVYPMYCVCLGSLETVS